VLSRDEQMHVIASGAAQIVPEEDLLEKLSRDKPLRIKLGVDPTAPDLHLGHAVPLRKLRQFQDVGHVVVLIIGDFTALVGDPSGRTATRPPLTPDEIETNAATYIDQAFKILDPDRTEMRRNSEWLGALDFARLLELTAQFTVARILERDDFRKRYEAQQPISLHEFLYPVMQAYDSVAIEADVELGGTDQLFNLLAGRELMEKSGMEPQVCLTLPLLEGTDGVQKMSKSYGNYVGLTEEPDEMFGKVMSIPDESMVTYYRLATALPVDEVDAVESSLVDACAHPNEVKRRLAREIVALYHDAEAAALAEEAFDKRFKRGWEKPDASEIEAATLGWAERPDEAGGSGSFVDLCGTATQSGLTASNSEALRLMNDGGLRLDDEKLTPAQRYLEWDDVAGRFLRRGKRKEVYIDPESERP
jgi:tyrosyl-tRNA synthetase